MSGTRIATIICWAVSALVLIGLLVWFILSFVVGGNGILGNINFMGIGIGGTQNLSGPFVSQGTQTADTTGINSMNISWVAGDITVTPHDGNSIEVTEYAQRDLRENERLHMSTNGSTLTIRFRESNNVLRNMPRKNLEVLVPRELSENLTTLTINTTSGNIRADSFEASTLNINSVSANIEISNIVSQTTDISTTSGNLTASSIRAGLLDINSVSGDMTITETIATILDTGTTSGRLNATGEFDRIDTNSVSGDKTIRSTTVPSTISSGTVSGDINVHIPNTGEITVSHSAVSGRFSSEVPARIQNGAAYSFSSVSGDTNIYALG